MGIGTKVKIVQGGRIGEVCGVWRDVDGQTKYAVRYINALGERAENWYLAAELKALKGAGQQA